MGCRRGCDSGVANLELIVKDLIRQMIEDGRLQEGIKDCNGQRLRRDWTVMTCELLGDAICQLMNDGLLCFTTPTDIVFDDDKHICILMSDGSRICTRQPLDDTYTNKATIDGTTITFTRTDGGTYKVNIAKALEAITATAVQNANGSYTITGTDGRSITIQQAKATVKPDGTVSVTGNDGKFVNIKQPKSGVGVSVGDDGTISIKTDNQTLRTNAHGQLEVIPPGCVVITDLNDLPFTDNGMYCIRGNQSTLNLPSKPTGEETQVPRSETARTDPFDWTGYVVRTESEAIVYVRADGVTWSSMNDNNSANGDRTPTTGWSSWARVENTAIPSNSIQVTNAFGDRTLFYANATE